MQTTTVRVSKPTQKKLKKLSADAGISITNLIDRLLEEQRSSFWKGFLQSAGNPSERQEAKEIDKKYRGHL